MMNIGCHLSSAAGFEKIAKDCRFLGANSFQFFSRNPRGSKAKKIEKEDLEAFFKEDKQVNFKIVAHAPYTLNLCSSTESIRVYSKNILAEDLKITELLPKCFYNLHPGSHTGQGVNTGIEQIAEALNEVLTKEQKTIVLLETMAGKGSEVGGKFEEIAEIIEKVKLKEKVGVCFDTCHTFDAGYDIVNDLEAVLNEFDKIIGLEKLMAVHLNDSKNTLGSKKDRHEQIGKGNIGLAATEKIINNKHLKSLPFILETPQESLEGYKEEISLVKSLFKD